MCISFSYQLFVYSLGGSSNNTGLQGTGICLFRLLLISEYGTTKCKQTVFFFGIFMSNLLCINFLSFVYLSYQPILFYSLRITYTGILILFKHTSPHPLRQIHINCYNEYNTCVFFTRGGSPTNTTLKDIMRIVSYIFLDTICHVTVCVSSSYSFDLSINYYAKIYHMQFRI